MVENDNSLTDAIKSPEKISYEEWLSRDGECITHVVGDSMLPLLKNRKSIVRVVAVTETDLKKNDVVLYNQDGKYVLHRIMKREADEFIIRGDNNNYLEKVSCSDILGVMDGFYLRASSPYISSRSLIYYLYVISLPLIRPTRRTLIRIKRTIKGRF